MTKLVINDCYAENRREPALNRGPGMALGGKLYLIRLFITILDIWSYEPVRHNPGIIREFMLFTPLCLSIKPRQSLPLKPTIQIELIAWH